MKNLNIDNLINVFKREKGKIAKNASKAAIATVMTMTQAGTVMANTSSKTYSSPKTRISHVSTATNLSVNGQKQEVSEKQMTYEEFTRGVYETTNELMKHILYPELSTDVFAAYYCLIYSYINKKFK